MFPSLRIALVQSPLVWEDPAANLAHFTAVLQSLPPADLVVLPEMFATGFTMQPAIHAEPVNGAAFTWLVNQAIAHKTAICGSLAVRDGNHFFNRFFFVYPDGNFVFYNKRHLFALANENAHYTPGTARNVINYRGCRILLQVCYDLRFPVFSRNRNDYDLALYVANWPERRSTAWKALLQARAIENQCFVVGVNRVGNDGNNISHAGHSAAYDFEGALLAHIPAHETGVAIAQCNLEPLQVFREKFPFLNDADSFQLL